MANISAIDLVSLIVLILSFIVFSIGYSRGRRRGYKEGQAEGYLILRENSYLQGKCVLCGREGNTYLITNTIKGYRKEEQLSEQNISVHL